VSSDGDPSALVEKVLEAGRNVRFGKGVVSKTSYIAAFVVAVWGIVAWKWSESLIMDAGLLVAGTVVTAFGVWFIGGTRRFAERNPELSFRIVAGAGRARSLGELPANVALETDIPLEQVRSRLAGARCVALPVRDNSYSGATTTLLQAMAMARPVIVSRTAAIAAGYELEDGVNCRLVEPGDEQGFERALLETLTGAAAARLLGSHARQTVERSFSWERFTDALWEVLCRC